MQLGEMAFLFFWEYFSKDRREKKMCWRGNYLCCFHCCWVLVFLSLFYYSMSIKELVWKFMKMNKSRKLNGKTDEIQKVAYNGIEKMKWWLLLGKFLGDMVSRKNDS